MQGYKDGEVAILTPYVGQLRLIQREVACYMTAIVNDRDAQDLALLDVSNDSVWNSQPVSPPATIRRLSSFFSVHLARRAARYCCLLRT